MDRAAWYEWTWLFVTDPEEVRRRVQRDPKVLEVRGLWGETPMMFLAIEGQGAAVLLALELGADPNARDDSGVSALQSCVGLSRSGRDLSPIISALLAWGADPYHFCETRACAWHLSRKNLSKSVQANFKDMPPPARLAAFGKWLGKLPRGALGYFDALSSEPLDVAYTDNSAATDALRRSLGIFLTLCDGSRLALWNHGGQSPAVVLLGSEGELKNVAPDFDSFLLAWSRGKCGIGDLDEEHDDVESARPALAKWLAAEGAKTSSATAPSFKSWFKKTVDGASPAAKKKALASPASAALAKAERVRVDRRQFNG